MDENDKKIKRQSKIIVACGMVLAVLVLLGAIAVLNNLPRSLGTSSVDPSSVRVIFNRDLVDTWHSDDDLFSAKIDNGEIDLRVNGTGGNAVYWYGSFDSTPKQDGVVIHSIPVNGKVYLSSAATKDFTYHSDRLSFEFSAAGVTKTVELGRG
jgi:hypothetical protein